MLLVAGEVPGLDILHITSHGIAHLLMEVEVLPEEAGLEFMVDAEHVMHDKHLAITFPACTDPDGRDGKAS